MAMQKNKGFTLVEMAVVITIIGMIIGGITLGSNLIHNAQLNNINTEMQKHIQAIKIFQDKYHAMPGDFSTATSYWSAATNGDGNGQIAAAEEFYAWYHLSLAQMVEGRFTGTAGTMGTKDRIVGTNIPASQFPGAGWGLTFIDLSGSTGLLYSTGNAAPNHVLWLGGRSISGTTNHQTPLLTSEEAELLDKKIDDGVPSTGKVMAQDNTSTAYSNCHASTSAYAVSTSGQICALAFRTGY